jgi:hypothetical protein
MTELIAVLCAGGLLDGQYLRFNESLDVLVGGREAGESTELAERDTMPPINQGRWVGKFF